MALRLLRGGARALGRAFPSARTTSRLDDLLADDSLDAVVVATPVTTHAELATPRAGGGKHCFVEKPLARSRRRPRRWSRPRVPPERVLMVGHLLEYHPGVERLRSWSDPGELGDLRYIYSNRLNLGKHRPDENALWSLGAHDVSVILRLAGEEPFECDAWARAT